LDAKVFISYSHRDTVLVEPVVSLLRATKGSPVFQDRDTIKPGTKWRGEIDKALETADLVLVFWCGHAQASPEVQREYSTAVNNQKNVVPLLIDSTPLPKELAEFQFIDFRKITASLHARTSKRERAASARYDRELRSGQGGPSAEYDAFRRGAGYRYGGRESANRSPSARYDDGFRGAPAGPSAGYEYGRTERIEYERDPVWEETPSRASFPLWLIVAILIVAIIFVLAVFVSWSSPLDWLKLLGVLAGVVLVFVALWTATRKILAVIGNRREARIHREMARAITTRLEAIERDDTVHSAATVGAAQPKS